MPLDKEERATTPSVAIAVARAEERERCAKALEDERDRILQTEGGFFGELVMYDVCALHLRLLAGREQN